MYSPLCPYIPVRKMSFWTFRDERQWTLFIRVAPTLAVIIKTTTTKGPALNDYILWSGKLSVHYVRSYIGVASERSLLANFIMQTVYYFFFTFVQLLYFVSNYDEPGTTLRGIEARHMPSKWHMWPSGGDAVTRWLRSHVASSQRWIGWNGSWRPPRYIVGKNGM